MIRRGFGLLELMVSMLLMTLISGGLFLIFRSSSAWVYYESEGR